MFERDRAAEYVAEILDWVKTRESLLSPVQLVSPQLARRRQLVEWTARTAATLQLTTQTVHLAIRYMDLFMSGHDIGDPQLYLVSICSLLVASKMCEKEASIPRLSTLIKQLPHDKHSSNDLHALEYQMLRFLEWDLNQPTCCYVTELLMSRALTKADLKMTSAVALARIYSVAEIKMTFLRSVKEMLDISLLEESMMQTPATVMAVCVLQASRLVTGLPWSRDLELVVSSDNDNTRYLTDCLVSLHKLQEDEVVIIDEGYSSINSSSCTV